MTADRMPAASPHVPPGVAVVPAPAPGPSGARVARWRRLRPVWARRAGRRGGARPGPPGPAWRAGARAGSCPRGPGEPGSRRSSHWRRPGPPPGPVRREGIGSGPRGPGEPVVEPGPTGPCGGVAPSPHGRATVTTGTVREAAVRPSAGVAGVTGPGPGRPGAVPVTEVRYRQ